MFRGIPKVGRIREEGQVTKSNEGMPSIFQGSIATLTEEMGRASFRKIKRLGIGRFVKKCPFWKKKMFIFLNLNKVSKTTSN